MNIETNKIITFYVKTFTDSTAYSIGMSKKKQDGSYQNFFIPVRITKNVEIENKEKAYIKQAWLEPYKDKDGKDRISIVINKIEKVEETINQSKSDSQIIQEVVTGDQKVESSDPFVEFGEELDLDDSSLPF